MIQRKQSVFLLLAFIASVVCLCLRIGDIEPAGMGVGFKLYNIMLDKGASVDYSPCGLFGILLVSSAMSLATIFLYRNRKLQSSLCLCNVFLLLAWYIVLGVVTRNVVSADANFHIAFAASIGEPPPIATIQSGSNFLIMSTPLFIVSNDGSGSTLSKIYECTLFFLFLIFL